MTSIEKGRHCQLGLSPWRQCCVVQRATIALIWCWRQMRKIFMYQHSTGSFVGYYFCDSATNAELAGSSYLSTCRVSCLDKNRGAINEKPGEDSSFSSSSHHSLRKQMPRSQGIAPLQKMTPRTSSKRSHASTEDGSQSDRASASTRGDEKTIPFLR